MPAAHFILSHDWQERSIPAGTVLNVSAEDLAALIKSGVAEDYHAATAAADEARRIAASAPAPMPPRAAPKKDEGQ